VVLKLVHVLVAVQRAWTARGHSWKKLDPIHPGEVLAEDFLKPLELTQYRLAQGLGVSARRINEIVHGKRSITADTALRLGRFFKNAPRFWLNLQVAYDLDANRCSVARVSCCRFNL